jgi:threonine dehydrogenase-like Zn-dependent dehydrogenase
MLSLLALSDVMGTGYHAAVSGGVGPGMTVAVVGDGAVGLSAVIASRRLGAARIIALSRNPARPELARLFGATDIVPERGDSAVAAVKALTDGLGVEAALECVGTGESMTTAFGIARPGTMVGAVGAPHDVKIPEDAVIFRNVGVRGGVAPVRRYLPTLIEDVLADRINPGRVFDLETDLDHVADAYRAMDERRTVKAAIRMEAAA